MRRSTPSSSGTGGSRGRCGWRPCAAPFMLACQAGGSPVKRLPCLGGQPRSLPDGLLLLLDCRRRDPFACYPVPNIAVPRVYGEVAGYENADLTVAQVWVGPP